MNPYLIPVLHTGPAILARLLPLLPPSVLDSPTHPERFTPREVIAHLADWEPIMRQRMQTAKESPGAAIAAYDEGEMAIANGYAQSDVSEQIALFQKERAATVAFLHTLTPEDWNKTVVHPERGELTLLLQANMLLGHDLYHIEQITACL